MDDKDWMKKLVDGAQKHLVPSPRRRFSDPEKEKQWKKALSNFDKWEAARQAADDRPKRRRKG